MDKFWKWMYSQGYTKDGSMIGLATFRNRKVGEII